MNEFELLNALPDAAVVVDHRGKIFFVNAETERSLGYAPQELLGQPVDILIPTRFLPKHREDVQSSFQSAASGSMGHGDVLHVRCKDGSELPAVISLGMHEVEGEHYAIALVHDMRARLRAEENSRIAEKRFMQLIDTLQEGIWVVDENARTTFVNTRVEEMLGFSAEELAGKWIFDMVPEAEQARLQEMIRRRRQGVADTYDMDVTRKDGQLMHLLIVTSPIMDEDGNYRGAIAGFIDNTERKKDEAVLKRWGKIFEHSGLGIVIGSADGESIEMMNPEYLRMHGWTREEMEKMRVAEVFSPAARQDLAEHIRIAHEKGHHSFESEHVRKDGSVFPVLIDVTTVKDERGNVIYRVVNVQDISERKKVEEQIQILLRVVEQSPNTVVITDTDGTIKYVNQRFCDMTGYTREEALGKNPNILRSDHTSLATYKDMWDTILDGREWRGELLNRKKDGTLFWEGITITPIKNARGETTHFAAATQDISTRRELEQERLERLLRAEALDSISRMLADITLNYDQVLQEIAHLVSEAVGDTCVLSLLSDDSDFLVPKAFHTPQPEALEIIRKIFMEQANPVDSSLAGRAVRSGNPVVIQEMPQDRVREMIDPQYHPFLDRFGVYALCVIPMIAPGQIIGTLGVSRDGPGRGYSESDVILMQELADRCALSIRNFQLYNANLRAMETLEARVEQRTQELSRSNRELGEALATLQQAQEELLRSDRLASLGALVAGVSHELNTPIGNSVMISSTLNAMAEAMRSQISDGGIRRSDLDDFLRRVEEAGDLLTHNLNTAGNLVSSFKQVAVDRTSEQRRVFCLRTVLEETVATLRPHIKKTPYQIEIAVEGKIEMDSFPGPLEQVISNLVNNALIHGLEGRHEGTIRIRAAAQDGGQVEISVEDDGSGIQPEHLAHIFDPFFTTKLGKGGSGLGLNIAYNIVTGLLGGQIQAESQPERGTRLTLRLPLRSPVRMQEDSNGV